MKRCLAKFAVRSLPFFYRWKADTFGPTIELVPCFQVEAALEA
jgi:hypothetical protein